MTWWTGSFVAPGKVNKKLDGFYVNGIHLYVWYTSAAIESKIVKWYHGKKMCLRMKKTLSDFVFVSSLYVDQCSVLTIKSFTQGLKYCK